MLILSTSCTKDGGWVEFQDWDTRIYSTDNSLSPEHDLYLFHKLTCDAQEQKGYNMSPGPRLEQWFRDAGFVNVQSHKYVLPLSTWPKDKHHVSTFYNILIRYSFMKKLLLHSIFRMSKV